jgi:hypothetical protein
MASQAPGTGLAIFDPKAGAPAHVAQFFDAEGTNIKPRTTVPSLSPEGKVWTISIDGTKTKMQRRNSDGDLEPLATMKVVILDYAKNRGRQYYEGDYDPNNVSQPICWSDDGVAPDDSLPGPFTAGTAVEPGTSRKISAACATCPMAVKGSKVDSSGKARTACSQHLMVAILPDPALGLPAQMQVPMRLKLAITSVWDKQSPDQEQQGWLAFDNYVQWLVARGVKHTAALVTKMKFDPEAAFPKIFFSAERYLEANEIAVVGPLTHDEEVKKLLGGTWTPAGVDGIPKDQQKVAEPGTGEPTGAAPQPSAAAPAAPEYRMVDGESFSREAYHASGWTDEQLIAAGKLIAVTPAPAAPEVVATPVAPPAPAAPAAQEAAVVVVGEPAATAVEPTATAAAASPPATAEVVVGEPAPAQTSAPSQPAAPPPNQEPAQAAAPAPSPAPVAPEPPAAAAAAAAVTAEVSTELPPDLAKIMGEWT